LVTAGRRSNAASLRRKSLTTFRKFLVPHATHSRELIFAQNHYFWGTSKGEMLALARSAIGDRVKFC
jgi:hypothetical protein